MDKDIFKKISRIRTRMRRISLALRQVGGQRDTRIDSEHSGLSKSENRSDFYEEIRFKEF